MGRTKWLELLWWEPRKGELEFYVGKWLIEFKWLKVTIGKSICRYRHQKKWG
jgi:hypothetical protein